ncbi:alpha/beta hydrolase [Vibrio sp. OCN044]|uniref:Alpha/beta hydrolase n=1 Tax=Vibrio tetraodonis subsp. pristinus TaxID=2695891 RepID=A0A6L8LXM7_9VIBR|nr:alpha/beta hydrolase-fold protein [Vibrio tetraodonis]MYM59856.1 alpha/beta hydrolase [Vibrio tetraodonis subsp. pristinus]
MRLIYLTLIFISSYSFANTNSFTFFSGTINEEVTLQVSLPDTYEHSNSFKYPVLVVLDGSTQFEHIAGSVRFLSTYAIIPEMIVVGVSTPYERLKFYTHTESEKYRNHSGQAELYKKFLQDELLNKIREDYRLAPYQIISGHSLSGLFTSYLALSEGSEFNAAISISPSLWWDKATLMNEYSQYQNLERKKPIKWFLSLANEPDEMEDSFNSLIELLNKKSPNNVTWSYSKFPSETHDSTPLIGNSHALKAIFSGWNAVPELDVMSLEKLEDFYLAKSTEYGYTFPMSVHQFNVYGLKAAYENKVDWGIAILERGVKTFEGSEILWDSLATAYSLNNEFQKAFDASEKALLLAQHNKSRFLSEIVSQHKVLKAKVADKTSNSGS